MDEDQQLNGLHEEMVIRDEDGSFKILKNGQLSPYHEPVSAVNRPSDEVVATGQGRPALQPPPLAVRPGKSAFYFSPKDEEEVANIKKTPADFAHKKYSLDKIVSKIIAVNKLESMNDELKKRLKTAAFSFLRDRRSFIDLTDILARAKENGGLGLASPLAAAVADLLKEVKDKITKANGLAVEEQEIAEKQDKPGLSVLKPVLPDFSKQPLPAAPVLKKAVALAKDLPKAEVVLPKSAEVKPEARPSFVKTSPVLQRSIKEGKVSMDDVQREFKLVGPVDELGNLSLTNFRRLGEDSQERAAKILLRIEKLGHESLARKASGIKAWRRSPLYKLYLAIGQSSMDGDLGIKEVISQLGVQGREVLTMEEFEAISDLNKKLRY